jgi:membrane-associated phospholipid phosphatase
MTPIHSLSQLPGPTGRSPLAVARALSIAFFMVAAAARCGTADITSPPAFGDPPRAAASPGELLASVRWNAATQDLIGTNRPSQTAAWRTMAYVTLAQHLAVEDAAAHSDVTRPKMRGAVAGSSARVLAHFFPGDSGAIEAIVRAEEASLPESQRVAFQSAEASGRAVGARLVTRARNDRFDTPWTGTVPAGPGMWASLAKPAAPPLLPLGGDVRPFFMSSGSQFRPAQPPAWNSPAYLEALAEVRRISDTRTPTQDSLAKFWALPTGGLVVGYWNTTAIGLIAGARLGERAAAHALALMNTAGWDAMTACHDAKYTYWLVRPSGADTAIRTSIGVPNHPSFPSNHACISGASAQVLGKLFPDARERMLAAANEAALSRLYGGIHYRFDMDAGLEIARRVAALATEVDRDAGLRRLVQ